MRKILDRTRHFAPLLALLLVTGFVVACGGGAGTEGGDQMADDSMGDSGTMDKTADLVYVNWAEGVAYTNLAKVILEDDMGYDVTITAADVAPAYTAVAQGDKDAFMETWLPVLHKDYIERFKDQVVDLGNVYEGTQSGLVVPSYVTIDKISELPAHADQFDDEIVGIDAGAGIMKTTEQLIDEYGLDYELVSSSGPAMTAALKKAIDSEDWIVVTGWKPHWMFGRWDLKFLQQDEDKVMWKKGNIHIMGRLGLKEDKPELAQFLENYFFTDAQLSDLMLAIKDADDSETAAREWKNAHPDLVASWVPEGAAG
jgi:glycine betaine/proline transport system substrate-binding protein